MLLDPGGHQSPVLVGPARQQGSTLLDHASWQKDPTTLGPAAKPDLIIFDTENKKGNALQLHFLTKERQRQRLYSVTVLSTVQTPYVYIVVHSTMNLYL
jgi:hypothetical protein